VLIERWCDAVLRHLLSRRVSVEAMIEFALWAAIPYIVVGLVFAFFGAEQVQLIETHLQTRLPAGADVAAYGLTALMWPATLFGVDVCVI
jgi:uncharacterized membrane protein (DUF441 family)